MPVPCVRVLRERGEEARQELAEKGLLDDEHDIEAEDGYLYIPVSSEVEGYDIVKRDATVRDQQEMPADILGWKPTYERLGDIVIIDEEDPARARAVAEAVMASDVRAETVVNRVSKVKGERRVRDWEVLAGNGTETVHREYGTEFLVDIAQVYFSPRLATERHRVIEQVETQEQFFDMFAGVGPFVVPAAKRGAECVGVDVNPAAIEYLRDNADRNGVGDRVTAIEGDVRTVTGYAGWADRIVMNLPHSADEFLDTAVTLASEESVLHYYDIQSDDDPFGPGETAIREAVDEEYDVEVTNERVVRSYAPHELNVCLDVRLVR